MEKNNEKGKNKANNLAKVLYVISAVLAAIFVYMVGAAVNYINSYMVSYGMDFSEMGMDAAKYVIDNSVSYFVYAVLIFSVGKLINMISESKAEDAVEEETIEEAKETETETETEIKSEEEPETVSEPEQEAKPESEEEVDEQPAEVVEEEVKTDDADTDGFEADRIISRLSNPKTKGAVSEKKEELTLNRYKKLQNGSDIRGVSLTGVPGELPNLTVDEARDIARGFLVWLCNKTGKRIDEVKIAMGRDPRSSGKRLLDGLMEGFGPYGVKAYDCGLASTPAMFMATQFPETECDGGIMITASHLPFNRNGFKFFTKDGGLDKADIKEILYLAENEAECIAAIGEPTNADGYTHRLGQRIFAAETMELMPLYTAHLRKLIVDGVKNGDKPLEGMKIVVDAGNGSGGFFARDVLEPLGADVSCSQFLDPDGTFPNHPPNPENKDAMHSVSMKTLSSGADFGLIFDTDVDRSAAVDGKGREIARNGIVAMAAALVAEEHPGTTVVTDSITSRQLTNFIEDKLGLKHLRFKRGYKNVINKSKELNEQGVDSQLAIETSGHAALKENYFLDDGAYLAVKIVIKAAKLKAEGKTIDSVIAELEEPADEKEIRIPITCEEFGLYGDALLKDLEQFVKESPDLSLEEPNYEGVRINFPEGWCLLRKSLHDPILPMNMAADKKGGCEEIKAVMAGFLSPYDQLDLSVMK